MAFTLRNNVGRALTYTELDTNFTNPSYANFGTATGAAIGDVRMSGNLYVSTGNATGGGIFLADDGDIVDLNDGYCAMRFSNGVRIYSAKSGGSPVIALGNGGAIVANGDITAYGSASDIRLKENIVKLDNSLNKILQLNGYSFNYIGNADKLIGVVAQEVEQVVPELVYEFKKNNNDNTQYKAVRYEHITALLVEAIKEQQQQIDQLRELVTQLTNK